MLKLVIIDSLNLHIAKVVTADLWEIHSNISTSLLMFKFMNTFVYLWAS